MQIADPRRFALVIAAIVTVLALAGYLLLGRGGDDTSKADKAPAAVPAGQARNIEAAPKQVHKLAAVMAKVPRMSAATTSGKVTTKVKFDRKSKTVAFLNGKDKITVLSRGARQYSLQGRCFIAAKVPSDVDTAWRQYLPLSAPGLTYKISGKTMKWQIKTAGSKVTGSVSTDSNGRIRRAQTSSEPNFKSVTTFTYPAKLSLPSKPGKTCR